MFIGYNVFIYIVRTPYFVDVPMTIRNKQYLVSVSLCRIRSLSKAIVTTLVSNENTLLQH